MKSRERYDEWLHHLSPDSFLRDELLAIREDEEEIQDRFYQELAFGTAGLRGKVGAGTNRMNIHTVGKATQGIASLICRHGREAMAAGVVITHDPRHFSREFCEYAASIFAANGVKVFLFPDMRSTPQLAYTIRKLRAISGINITASHNPKEYNGYKAYWKDGCQVSSEIADQMTAYISSVNIWEDIKTMDVSQGIRQGLITLLGESHDRAYLDEIEGLALHRGDVLDLSIPLVYTPLNGCGSLPFRQVLKDRGFSRWMIVPEQENPDPDFSTVGYPNPEDSKAFALAEKYGRDYGAELLMATDPDADRFAIEIRNHEGDYIPLNGNQTGYILVDYILRSLKEQGRLPEKGAMVKSIVTSTLSTRIAEDYDVTMFETLTGFKNICGKIPALHQEGYTYLFGYEESVGYAASENIRDKDGISAGMLVAEAAAYYRKQGKTLWDILQEIYQTYGFFAEDEPSIVLEGIAGAEKIQNIMTSVRAEFPTEVCGYRVSQVIDYKEGIQGLPPHNAIRIFLENRSWFAIRPSGTEPKIKFYFYSWQDSHEQAMEVNRLIKEAVFRDICHF